MKRLVVLLVLAFISYGARSQGVNSTSVGVPGLCNSVAFAQVPTDENYFVGRVLKNTSSDKCSGSQWALALFRADWQSNALTTLNLERTILSSSTQVQVNGTAVTLGSYYDPSIVVFNNELWVAFECAGTGISHAASCVAPMTPDMGIDPTRLIVAVKGTVADQAGNSYSASVPKLLVFDQQLYLYWTASHFYTGPSGVLLKGATTRGARLEQESGGLRRLWVTGAAGVSIDSNDSVRSQEVYGPNSSDTTANFLADTFDVRAEGGQIYVTAAVGGVGCSTPLSEIYGCYRLRVSSTTVPLGYRIFNGNFLASPDMPVNPQEYTKLFRAPDGNRFLMGQYLPAVLNHSPSPGVILPTGLRRVPVNLAEFNFLPTGNDEGFLPNPQVAATTLPTRFSILQNFHPGCTSSNAVSVNCFAAIGRFCVSQGFAAAGHGPSQHVGNDVAVLCLRSDNAARVATGISSLTALVPSCTSANLASDSCSSAISRFCVSRGFGSGGFGPTEWSGSNINVTCVQAAQADRVSTTFTVLTTYQAACTGSTNTTSTSCFSASESYCAAHSYVGAYGILDHVGNNAIVGCVK